MDLAAKIDLLSDATAIKLLAEIKEWKKERKKSKTFVSFPKEALMTKGTIQAPRSTVSSADALKYVLGEMLHDIDKKPMASVKASVVEAFEWIAATEKDVARRTFLRKKVCGWIMMDDPIKLIQSVGGFAASLT